MRTVVWLVAVTLAIAPLTDGVAQRRDTDSGNYWLGLCDDPGEGVRAYCWAYIQGLNGTNDLLKYGANNPIWCLPSGVTTEQMRLVILKAMRAKPEDLHFPFAGLAIAALIEKFPCAAPAKR
jgi:hypothetical protein